MTMTEDDTGMDEAREDDAAEERGVPFEALLERFLAKMRSIPGEYHLAMGWLYVYRQIQDQRKRLMNRANQFSEGKRVFWRHVLPLETRAPMQLQMEGAAAAIEEAEKQAARHLHRAMLQGDWYRQVAVPAAGGVGMSDAAGTLSAAKILWAYGSMSRFGTFGQLIRYSRLAPEGGKAPKRSRGARIHYNPAAWQALYDLSESWNRLPECKWRLSWDAWKAYYAERFPGYPKGRIHNMARRKVLREFLHELWDLWRAWEQNRTVAAD